MAGVIPEENLVPLVVEDKLALVQHNGQHRMTLISTVKRGGDEEDLFRETRLYEQSALEEDIVLAVAIAVIRVGPFFDDSVMFEVGYRLDATVDPLVDVHQVAPHSGVRH